MPVKSLNKRDIIHTGFGVAPTGDLMSDYFVIMVFLVKSFKKKENNLERDPFT